MIRLISSFRLFFVLLGLFCTTCGLQCLDEQGFDGKDELPPLTFTGANTFGCKLNGQVWLPFSKTAMPDLMANYDRKFKQLYVSGLKKSFTSSKFETISINIFGIETTGKFYLKGTDISKESSGIFTPFEDLNDQYQTNNSLLGTVELLKFDTLHQIASGTFAFTASNGIDTVTVTEGRFDVTYVR